MKMQCKRSVSLLVLIISCIILLSLASCGEDNPQAPDPIDAGPDTIPPATVTELLARNPTASTVALVWFAPGDDGSSGQAASYDIRYSKHLINEQNWDSAKKIPDLPAPKPAGQLETVIVTGLPSSSQIFFALKTCDEIPNESGLSNNAFETTLKDLSPPAPVYDLKALAVSDTEFLLTWTSPGDDWMDGTASEYDIRYDRFSITDENWDSRTQVDGESQPKPAGSPDSFTVSGLMPNSNYFFAMKTTDDTGNQSTLSNLSPALALSNYLLISPLRPNLGEDMQIVFKTSPDMNTKVIIWRRYYIIYQGYVWTVFRHLVNKQYQGETELVIWDTTNDDGETEPNSWAMQYRIQLVWGSAPIDTLNFQILQ